MNVADKLRELRARVLENPRLLMGTEPSIDALWGWVQATTHAIDVAEAREPGSWGRFLHSRNFGMRGEYAMMRDRMPDATLAEKAAFLCDLYAGYDEWLKSPERSGRLFMLIWHHSDGSELDLLEPEALERMLKREARLSPDVVSQALGWAGDAEPGRAKSFGNFALVRVLAGTSLADGD